MSKLNYRVGQIVPSSNVTMEPERFTFHSSRMRMKVVSKEELAAIQAQTGIPTLSAAVATTHQMLSHLGLSTRIPDAGALLE